MQKDFPTLVTYRAAEALRDEGMRYAFKKAGMHAGFIVGFLGAILSLILITFAASVVVFIPVVVSGLGFIAAVWFGRGLSFPHFPRLTLSELEAMEFDMGLRADIFKDMHDNVLHGSEEERNSIIYADKVLKRFVHAKQRPVQ